METLHVLKAFLKAGMIEAVSQENRKVLEEASKVYMAQTATEYKISLDDLINKFYSVSVAHKFNMGEYLGMVTYVASRCTGDNLKKTIDTAIEEASFASAALTTHMLLSEGPK